MPKSKYVQAGTLQENEREARAHWSTPFGEADGSPDHLEEDGYLAVVRLLLRCVLVGQHAFPQMHELLLGPIRLELVHDLFELIIRDPTHLGARLRHGSEREWNGAVPDQCGFLSRTWLWMIVMVAVIVVVAIARVVAAIVIAVAVVGSHSSRSHRSSHSNCGRRRLSSWCGSGVVVVLFHPHLRFWLLGNQHKNSPALLDPC